MSAKDHVHEVEELIADGSKIVDAVHIVAAQHGLKPLTMQTAYYRSRRDYSRKRKAKPAKTPKAIPPAALAPPPSLNGEAQIEDLIARLKAVQEEEAATLAALEHAIAEHVLALARVRAVLAS